jgi:cold shock CspA family protein
MIEKGTDVWLALDAYEAALQKNLDIVVIVTSDTDFKPLIRKLHSLGAKTMLLSWNLEWEQEGEIQVTKTSRDLTEEVTWFIDVAKEFLNNSEELKSIFVQKNDKEQKEGYQTSNYKTKYLKYKSYDTKDSDLSNQVPDVEFDPEQRVESEIQSIKNGYGFILYPEHNIFFHAKDIINCNFEDLEIGDAVEFQIYCKPNGEMVAKQISLLFASDEDSTQY